MRYLEEGAASAKPMAGAKSRGPEARARTAKGLKAQMETPEENGGGTHRGRLLRHLVHGLVRFVVINLKMVRIIGISHRGKR